MLPDVNLGTVRVCRIDVMDWLGEAKPLRQTSPQRCLRSPTLGLSEKMVMVVGKQYITEIKYLCFAGKIIKSVPSKLIKEVSHALLGCVCMQGLVGGLLATVQCSISVMRFLHQKGQHLEPFIQSFFNSCESPKPKPSRPELTILSPTSENDKKVRGSFSWSSTAWLPFRSSKFS